MTPRRLLALALVAGASASLLAEAGAFSAITLQQHDLDVDVVGNDVSYHAWKSVPIRVPSLLAFSERLGLIVWNNGTAPTRYTWVEESDSGGGGSAGALDSVVQCATTGVGSRCEFRFAGDGLATGTYTVGGLVYGDTSPRQLNSTIRSITIDVESCLTC